MNPCYVFKEIPDDLKMEIRCFLIHPVKESRLFHENLLKEHILMNWTNFIDTLPYNQRGIEDTLVHTFLTSYVCSKRFDELCSLLIRVFGTYYCGVREDIFIDSGLFGSKSMVCSYIAEQCHEYFIR